MTGLTTIEPTPHHSQTPVLDKKMVLEINTGELVLLKKKHPCGNYEWQVVRVGADIGIKCIKCGHCVLIERSVFERRVKVFISRE